MTRASEATDRLDDIMARACNVLRAGQARTVTVVLGRPFEPAEVSRLHALAAASDLSLSMSDAGVMRLRRGATIRQPWYQQPRHRSRQRRGAMCAASQTMR